MIGRALALALATLLFTAPVASAAEMANEPVNWARHGNYLEAGGGVRFEQFRATTNRGTPTSGEGGNFSLTAGWRPADRMAFEIQYERVFSLYGGDPLVIPSAVQYDANVITINAKYFLFRGRRWQPFIRTGLGAIFGDLPSEWSRKSPPGTDSSQSSFLWKIGAGLDWPFSNHVTGSLYLDYVIPMQEFHKLNWVTLGAGVRYMF